MRCTDLQRVQDRCLDVIRVSRHSLEPLELRCINLKSPLIGILLNLNLAYIRILLKRP